MPRLIDIIGKRFGRLIVTSVAHRDKFNHLSWRCRCMCGSGKTKIVRGADLRSGATSSCGCLHGNRLRPFEALYRVLKRTALYERGRVIPVSLSYKEFLSFTRCNRCYYCWAPIVWKKFQIGGHGYNLDRKDSQRGYSKKNCVVCCARCNIGKSSLFSFREWRRMTRCLR